MFEEGQLYSPVTHDEDGKAVVHLGEEHPGFNDPAYRERRNEIATAATLWSPGRPIPQIAYTAVEDDIWRTVSRELRTKHETYACREFLAAKAALSLPEDHVPQLDEVTERLKPLTGFEYHPAAGLVPLRQFYGSLADRVFHSTQYVRHPSEPLYTPEPDIVHEVIGHGNMLASPRFAANAFAATPERAADRRVCTTTPVAPVASAVRRMAPRLCGSSIPSSTTIKGGALAPRTSSSRL